MRHEPTALIRLRRATPEERAQQYALDNPGTINLATAENVLVFDAMQAKLRDASALGLAQTKYNTSAWGSAPFRGQLAAFLSESFGLADAVRLGADAVVGMSGVSAALEALAFTEAIFPAMGLGHGQGKVLLPTPCWQGFEWAFHYRAGHQVIQVPVAPESFELTLAQIQDAYDRTPAPKPRLLALTNPNNPLGTNYDKPFLEALYSWVLDHTQMHIVSDEIYAHSQIGAPARPFVSALALDTYAHHAAARKRVHVVWGFAKDFGLSGFKTGFLLTHSHAVRDEVTGRRMAWMSPFDTLKEFMIGKLTEEPSYLRALTATYRGALTAAHRQVRTCLDDYRIRYFAGAEAAQFFWLDLRQYMGWTLPPTRGEGRAHRPSGRYDGPTASLFQEIESEDEKRLDGYLKEHAGVLLLPGQIMFNPTPGFYRLCFTAEPADRVNEAIQRVHDKVLSRLTPP